MKVEVGASPVSLHLARRVGTHTPLLKVLGGFNECIPFPLGDRAIQIANANID